MRVALAVALLAVTSACVSTGKYKKMVAEADAAKARGVDLEAALARKEGDLEAARATNRDLEQKVEALSASANRLEAAKEQLEKKSAEYERMAGALRGQIEAGRIELTELRGKMTVKMKDKILFSSGSATIGRDGREALGAVAGVLKDVGDKLIRVEGHTDDVPVGRGPYATNWELSVARALAVVRFLQEEGVDPARLAAAGYGEYQPIAANDTPEGRSQNRRIEIVLAPSEEAPPAQPAKM